MSQKSVFSSTTLLSLAVGLFLLLSGVLSLVDANSVFGKMGGLFVDDTTKAVNLVAAILEIASGAVLLLGPFGLLNEGIRTLAFWIVAGFWAALTVWIAFKTLGAIKGDAKAIMTWLYGLSLNVAVLAAIWQLKPGK